ncbi:MAG TPA: DUF433 domain-containing protein [Mycobacteriales bacterium]|nr:DUF433 domain-containing protein [Mycobacteriales bacterium]
MTVSLLDRRLYSMADVGRLLGLQTGTVRRWIDGHRRQERIYPPVLRAESTGDETVTWGEFVETRLLAEYRKYASLQRLRPAIQLLREEIGPYPLAHAHPFLDVAGKELVRRIQDRVGLQQEEFLVIVRTGQQLLTTAPVNEFLKQVEFSDGSVSRLTPCGRDNPVRIDPVYQTGRPVVRAVPTDVIAEQFRAGESTNEIADAFDLNTSQVESALRFELGLATAA